MNCVQAQTMSKKGGKFHPFHKPKKEKHTMPITQKKDWIGESFTQSQKKWYFINKIEKMATLVLLPLLLLMPKNNCLFTIKSCKSVYIHIFIRDACAGLPSIQFSLVQPDKLCVCVVAWLDCLVDCVNVFIELQFDCQSFLRFAKWIVYSYGVCVYITHGRRWWW